jgi:hypothetical protein
MKLYTLHTHSHQKMFDEYFKPSLIPGEYELFSFMAPQECQTGSQYQNGWDKTTYRKAELFLQIAEQNKGDIVLFSDVDIQFFGRTKEVLLEELGDYDMATQYDGFDKCCSGFFIFRANDAIIEMFKNILNNFSLYEEDQTALNCNRDMVKWKYLSNRFFSIFHTFNRIWSVDEDEDIVLPKNILVHHANWCFYEDKIALLELVRVKKLSINS